MTDKKVPSPRIISFAYEGPPVRYNNEIVRFTWNVQEAERISLNGKEMPMESSYYDHYLSGLGVQEFVLGISAGDVKVTESVQIKVLQMPHFTVREILVPMLDIERKISIEANFEFKQINVGVEVNTLNPSKYKNGEVDVSMPEVKINEESFVASLINRVTDKILTIWNR